MDCVTDDGDVAIVYCADLNWRGIRMHLSSVLSAAEGQFSTRSTISRYGVKVAGDHISAELPKLGVTGIWEADSPPFERIVYEHEAGSVRWNCLQPRSMVNLRVGDRKLRGLGYAECLTVSIVPWRLPLKQLRWGRFVSPQDSLAWVDWQGAYSTGFALSNGEECTLLSASDTEIAVPDAKLHIDSGFPLRSGRLESTILPDVPAIGKLFPHSLFSVEEHKWRSRGVLTACDRSSTGWVIHEVVKWKN
jgi:hypothetical protein